MQNKIEIKEVCNRGQLKTFVEFPNKLYKNNKFYVPALTFDELSTLDKKKNPAFDYSEAKYWLAFKDKKVVGRIAAILNKAYIEKWHNKYIRFGWFDFEEDEEVAKALLGKVEEWAKEVGMSAIHGPLGFTDLDYEGMLVEGFDQLGTLATLYNYPYYPATLEKLGFTKEVDWLEYKIKVPSVVPEKLERLSSLVESRYHLKVIRAKKSKEILPYAKEIFELMNISYAHLFGVVPLTEKQVAYYTKQYFGFIRTDFVPIVVNENGKLVAFGITMPSLSDALQKSKGSLFPFGFLHLLKAIHRNKFADLYLVAVDTKYQGKGLNAILMNELTRSYIKNGIKYAESNPELELNTKVQSFWEHFDAVQHKRRRCYIKQLSIA